MTVFFQAAAGVLIASVLGLTLSGHSKEISLVLTVLVCAMLLILCASVLEPVLDFTRELVELGNLDDGIIHVLLKATGIALVAEIAGMVCTDAGNASLGKGIRMLGTAVILWLAIPVFNGLLELIRMILGGL
jgi:stage III sporulation protein AD